MFKVTCKQACLIAADKALAKGDIATHLRMIRLASLCTK